MVKNKYVFYALFEAQVYKNGNYLGKVKGNSTTIIEETKDTVLEKFFDWQETQKQAFVDSMNVDNAVVINMKIISV